MDIEQTVLQFFQGNASLEATLNKFSNTNEGFSWAFANTLHENRYVAWYALLVLDTWINQNRTPVPYEQLLERLVASLFAAKANRDQERKLAVLICALTRRRATTPDGMADVLRIVTALSDAQCVLLLLQMMADEFRDIPVKAHLLTAEKAAIKANFEAAAPSVIGLLVRSARQVPGAVEALVAYMRWVPVDVLQTNHVFETLAQTLAVPQLTKPTIDCLVEFLTHNTLPSSPAFVTSYVKLMFSALSVDNTPLIKVLNALPLVVTKCFGAFTDLDTCMLLPPLLMQCVVRNRASILVTELCFQVLNAFFESPVSDSLCVTEEFARFAQAHVQTLLACLFFATNPAISHLDVSSAHDEPTELDEFVQNAIEALVSFINFQPGVVLPVVQNTTNHFFSQLSNNFPTSEPGLFDLTTAFHLLANILPNLSITINDLTSLTTAFTPFLHLLQLLPAIAASPVLPGLVRAAVPALNLLYPLLAQFIPDSVPFAGQFTELLLKTTLALTQTPVIESLFQTLSELVLSLRPHAFSIPIIKLLLLDTKIVSTFQPAARLYGLRHLLAPLITPSPSVSRSQLQAFSGSVLALTQLVLTTPLIETFKAARFQAFLTIINVLPELFASLEDIGNTLKAPVKTAVDQFFGLVPEAMGVLPAPVLHAVLSTAAQYLRAFGATVDATFLAAMLNAAFRIFSSKVKAIVAQQDEALMSALNAFLKFLVRYILLVLGTPRLADDSLTLMCFLFCYNDLALTLTTETCDAKFYQTAFTLLFLVSDNSWGALRTNTEFFQLFLSLVLRGLSLPNIELVRLVIKETTQFNSKRLLFASPEFMAVHTGFLATLLPVVCTATHSLDDYLNLLYLLLNADVPPLVNSFSTYLLAYLNTLALSDEQKQALVRLFPHSPNFVAFSDAFAALRNDLFYYLG